MKSLLEVAVRHARDVPGAVEGGADRLVLAVGPSRDRSPDVPTASAVLHATDLPVRVMLRLDDGYSTSGGELMRLIGLGEEYLGMGAEGLVFGFLDADLEIDVDTTWALSKALPGVPWTFHRGVDVTLDARRTWSRLVRMPSLSSVMTAGCTQDVEQGIDELLAIAASSIDIPRFLMPAGDLRPEHVPWLARAGVRQWHLDDQVLPGRSQRAYVDAEHVRSWRLLVDDATARAEAALRRAELAG